MNRDVEKFPQRRTEELHVGRLSLPGARYFLTFVTREREPWLLSSQAADAVLRALRRWHEEKDGAIIAATVMPDHVHVILELGSRLSAGQCVGRWKSEIRRAIDYRHDWLRDFYEHRLRANESVEDYALYVFLNPYRAHLTDADKSWPWWWAPNPGLFRFSELLNGDGTPPREWVDWPDDKFAHLSAGE